MLELIKEEKWEQLMALDELQRELLQGKVLCGFQTAPCLFAPTFKVCERRRGCYGEPHIEGFVHELSMPPWHARQGQSLYLVCMVIDAWAPTLYRMRPAYNEWCGGWRSVCVCVYGGSPCATRWVATTRSACRPTATGCSGSRCPVSTEPVPALPYMMQRIATLMIAYSGRRRGPSY